MPVGIAYDPCMVVDIYRMAMEGMARSNIAKAIGTDKRTFKKWMVRHPEVKKALDQGYGKDGSKPFQNARTTFAEYCLTALPPDLHELWQQLNDMDEQTGEKRYDMLMQRHGRRVKQQIFLHSLISTNFNKFAAMRRACISHSSLDKWKREDPEFMDLINHIHEMKRDFIEGALMGLVAGGDTSATIFAAKSLLPDRGYGSKLTIEHKGETTNKQIVLGKIIHKLPVKSKRALLRKLREERTKALPPRVVQTEEVK